MTARVCSKCGLDKDIEEFRLRSQSPGSIDALMAEIQNCDGLCANCHRILTAKERGWFRSKK